MDPRHPELAISRMRELMKQYDRVEKDMNKATTSAQLAKLEREGGLVVQEICLVAPRIHEAMMQTSRQRRHDLSHGILEKPVEKLKDDAEFKKVIDESIEVVEKAKDIVEKALKDNADVIGEENIGGESGPAKKPVEKTPEIASEGILEVIKAAKENAEAEKKTVKKTTRKKKTTKKAEK